MSDAKQIRADECSLDDDNVCVICGCNTEAGHDMCAECFQMTLQNDEYDCDVGENGTCKYARCNNSSIYQLDVCGCHLIAKIFGIIPPYAKNMCNVDGCTNQSIDKYYVCEEHWLFAYKSYVAMTTGVVDRKTHKYIEKTGDDLAPASDDDDIEKLRLKRAIEHIHHTTPTVKSHAEKLLVSENVVVSSDTPKLCKCGKPADPKGNMCHDCYKKYVSCKYGKCRCGEPLGERGTMCVKCFDKYKTNRYGKMVIRSASVQSQDEEQTKNMTSEQQVAYPTIVLGIKDTEHNSAPNVVSVTLRNKHKRHSPLRMSQSISETSEREQIDEKETDDKK